jgi:ribosomal protein L11 methylase PrmA
MLSGVLAGQADQVVAAYEADFSGIEVVLEDGWALITGTRR